MVFHLWNRHIFVMLSFVFLFRGLKSQNGLNIETTVDVRLLPNQTAMMPPTSLVLLHVLLFQANVSFLVPHLTVVALSMSK